MTVVPNNPPKTLKPTSGMPSSQLVTRCPSGVIREHGRTHSKAKEQEPEQKAPKRKHKTRKHHSTEESAQGEITQANR